MSNGWEGGTSNRTWQRDRRSAVNGRISLADDVRRILEDWRAAHGWQPGSAWNPRTGTYEKAGR